jgi:ABC-type transport system involved in multi-copper enzyme maturation permease subunit
MTSWIALISAIAALITGLAALISALRGHTAINKEIKPAIEELTNGHDEASKTA